MDYTVPTPCILHEGIFQLCIVPRAPAFSFVSRTFPLETLAWYMARNFMELHCLSLTDFEAPFIRKMRELAQNHESDSPSAHTEMTSAVVYEIVARSWQRLQCCQFILGILKERPDAILEIFPDTTELISPANADVLTDIYTEVRETIKGFVTEIHALDMQQQQALLASSWQQMLATWEAFATDTFLDYSPHFISKKQVLHYLQTAY